MENIDPLTAVTLEIRGYIGIITLNREKNLNAMTAPLYSRISTLLDELAANPDTYVTLITGKGRFFSAGADVASLKLDNNYDGVSTREYWIKVFVSNSFHNTHAWYSHPKILIAALNGPVVGVSAAFISHCDFIYAAPHAYLLTPFSSIGLVAEGGASRAFVSRMGLGLANEALIMSRKISVEELLHSRFVNKIIGDAGGGHDSSGKDFDSDKFLEAVLEEVDARLGRHLVKNSVLKIKALIRRQEMGALDKAGVAEVLEGLNGFVKGVPQEGFRKVKSGEKRHKL